ncbi:VOG4848 [uncultured phage cr23_1]|uniref:VOG4848 n=1 Tax=uncultured phage cr23_1 TaxID=2986419 RepID=UPI001C765B64|nr:VOG4848 [uncultured phage cr23_1]
MRDRGTFNFSGNLEVKKDAPLEARSLVNSYADLVKPETWTDELGGIWKYDCMLVSCKDRPGKIYQLSPGADYTKESSWILIGDTSELNNKVQQFINSKGAPNGLASLNESGIIPSAQLPSYVDDVIEVDTFSNLPGTGESGKIYIVQDTNLTYRWSGTDYVEISKSLALGETSSTAYPGDKGKATTDKLNRIPDKLITDTVNVNQSTTEAVLNFTTYRQEALLVGRNTLTITSATTSQAGLMSSSDKTKLDGLKDQAGITSDIDAVLTNLETHINNKFNPHEVTKAQVGLSEVDNTSDANKPISTATQNALNGKFSATDGNALKLRVDNIPELVATDITVDSDNDSVNISLDKTSIVDGTLSGTTININSATASKAGILVPTDKSKIDKIITNGNGTKYLSDNGTYKEVSGGSSSSDINIIELQDIRDIISIVYHEKDRASSDISSVFGGSANFRSIVNDILKTHTRYFFHVKDTPDTNCIQLSGVNAWKNIDNTQYELHFIYNYYISNGNQRTCRRVTVIDSDNTDSNLFIVENVNDMYVLSKDRDRCKSVSLVGEGFDENHWYPVSFTADPNSIVPPCNLIIWNSLNNDSAGISPKPSWATNNGGFVLHIDMTIIGDGYGQYTYARNKLNNWHGEWGGETAVGEMRLTTQTSTFYIYLRGGANYFYTSDYADLKMTAHSSEVLDGYNTYSIKDTQGDIKDFFVYVENDLFGEVKNLQIVHDNEFNFANDSIGNYVWINYRSRYDSVTSAKAVYVGNGQAGADGAFGAIHASGFFKESDVRLKSNIVPLNHTLDQICNIPTVEFDMHDKHQIGTVALNLENNFAEIVNTDSDGMKSVDYCMLGVVAIEGIKLLKLEVEDLKKQIEELKNGK